jgi:Mg2+ and Co2+ transporter CorA
MEWNDEKQARLNSLRSAELSGALDERSQKELQTLIELLDMEEQERLAPVLAQMRAEQDALRQQARESETTNEQLATLAAQQEQWLADARLLLRDLNRRHRVLQETYETITGEPLAVA